LPRVSAAASQHLYLVAKVFEYGDTSVYAAGQIVSGHTIKHLMAAIGMWFLVAVTRQRAAIGQKQDPPDAVNATRPVS
jgi:hypothetical protein